jgi:hypothetical protein
MSRLGAVLAIHLDPRCREPGQPDIPVAGSVGACLRQHGEVPRYRRMGSLIWLGEYRSLMASRAKCLIMRGLPPTLPTLHS